MPIHWDAAADRKLLLGILKMQNVSVDTEAMAKYMSTAEQVCTPSAISNRVHKLKTLAKEDDQSGSPDGGDGTPKSKGTPRKRAAAATDDEKPAKKGKTKMDKGKEKAVQVEDADDEEAGTKVKVKDEEIETD